MRKLLRITLWLLIVVILLVMLLLGIAASNAGSAFLVRTAAAAMPNVEIEGMEGSLLSTTRIARLRVKDRGGVWLEAEQLLLCWAPGEALRGHWHVTELSAQKIDLLRAPVGEGKPSQKSTRAPGLPHLPWIAVDKLEIARLDIAPALTGGLPQNLHITGKLARGDEGALDATLHAESLEGVATQLDLEASLADRLAASVTLHEAPGGALGTLAAIDPAQALSLRVKLNGTPQVWQGGIMLREGETPLLDLVADAENQRYSGHWTGHMPSRLATLHPPLAALGADHHGAMAVQRDIDGSVSVEQAQVSFDRLSLTGNGSLGSLHSDFAATLSVPSLAPFSAMAHQPLAGSLISELTVKGPSDEGRTAAGLTLHLLNGEISGRAISEASVTSETTLDLAAFRLTGWGEFASKGSGQIGLDGAPWQVAYAAESTSNRKIDHFELTASQPALQLKANGSYDLANGALDAEAMLKGALAALPAQGVPEGNVELALKAKGDAAKLSLAVQGKADHLAGLPAGLDQLLRGALTLDADAVLEPARQFTLDQLRLKGDGITLSAKGRYGLADASYAANLDGEGRIPNAPALTLALDAEGDRAASRIKELRLHGSGLALVAAGRLTDASGVFDGSATLDADDLSSYSAFAGMRLGGRLDAKAKMSDSGGAQGLTATATAERLLIGTTTVARLNLDARASDLRNRRGIKAALHGQGITSGGLTLSDVTASAETAPKDALAFRAKLQGSQGPTPLDAALAGSWRQDGARQAVTLASLDGHYAQKPLHLAKPATFTKGGGELWITPLEADVAGGRLTAQGGVRGGKAALEAALSGLPLAAIPGQEGLGGTLAATVKITGSAASPTARFSADAKADAGSNVPPLALHAEGTLAQRLEASAKLALNGGEASLSATLPARLSLAPPSFTLAQSSPMKGQGNLSLAVDAFNPWLRRLGHEAGGRAEGSFTLGGTLQRPQGNGTLRLKDARYDHLPSGVCLRSLNAEIDASERSWRLASLSARDSQGGSLTGSGQGSFAPAAPLTADLGVQKLRLFCRGMATGEVDGALHARGTLAKAELGGALRLGPMAINLPGGGESRIPEITVVRKGERPADHRAPGAESHSIALAIDVRVPDRVFVRGRGLDAELEGRLHIGGTAAEPDITGKLQTKRGRFDLLDRPLSLTKAELQFGGSIPPSPFLSVEATTKVEDVTITVALSGPAQKPDLALSSSPALPQDELLSRLLFGRDVKSISAFQAIQLAQSVASLSGKSSGPGLLDQARSALGVDTLTLDQGSNNETTVGAGKYISDKVYVGVAQGASPEDRKVTTEIEVTPSVSAGTTTDAEGHAGANLQWKWDY